VSKIEIGRYSELLRRQFGMKGQEVVASELSPEVSPVVILENAGAEWDFLKGVRGCRCSQDEPGVALNTTVFRLRNAQDSGVIAIIDELVMSIGPGATVSINRGQIFGDLATGLVTVVPDLRWGAVGATTTALTFSVTTAGLLGPAGDEIAVENRTNRNMRYRQPIVLIPGTSLDWGTVPGETAIPIRTYVSWRERQIPQLEL